MLLTIGEDLFFSPTYGCDVTFDKDEKGAVTALVYRPVGMSPFVFRRKGR
ncbi:MAG: hypothetical protein GY711_16940 [bacterium]|nr:hypothetical protein [bacterium]